MQVWKILILASVVAAIPMANASNPEGCEEALDGAAGDETLVHPLNGRYVVLTPGGIETWDETNDVANLQRTACEDDSGVGLYDADKKDASTKLL